MTKSILAIETCSESCSVALHHQNIQYQQISTEPRGHADNVLPMVEQVLADAKISLKSLDAIAFTRGPGAFTGVRIGTSVAQGLSLGTNLPLIAVSSLAVLAQGSYRGTSSENCLAALDARMSEVYFGQYQLNSDGLMVALQDDQVASPNAVTCVDEDKQVSEQNEWYTAGAGWLNYSDDMIQRFKDWNTQSQSERLYPEAIDLLTLAQWHYANGDLLDPAEALPVYVRDQEYIPIEK